MFRYSVRNVTIFIESLVGFSRKSDCFRLISAVQSFPTSVLPSSSLRWFFNKGHDKFKVTRSVAAN